MCIRDRYMGTELCKNWEYKRKCEWGDKCSYAHGFHELKPKVHLHQNYRTKLCKQFHEDGHCQYGYRCQFVHLRKVDDVQLKSRYADVNNLLEEIGFSDPFQPSGLYFAYLQNPSASVNELKVKTAANPRRRLPIFQKIARH
eukprot:TRINITY_DN4601_c0_g1_i5.p1 TRINITY_DN4601_c0_g1~~TRINITY_DN4601_c0_g1_i5.p1  ORF type:complete len:142 (+),score=14.11 TRINITY_DN4601_c0_g1_i5:65-490(+)